MNEFLSYQIKIPLEAFEVEELAKVFIADVNELSVNQDYLCQTINDIIIFQFLIRKTVLKLEMDERRKRIEGYLRKKPYQIKLTKPQIYWLWKYIETAQLVELSNLHTNILGRHITELLND